MTGTIHALVVIIIIAIYASRVYVRTHGGIKSHKNNNNNEYERQEKKHRKLHARKNLIIV